MSRTPTDETLKTWIDQFAAFKSEHREDVEGSIRHIAGIGISHSSVAEYALNKLESITQISGFEFKKSAYDGIVKLCIRCPDLREKGFQILENNQETEIHIAKLGIECFDLRERAFKRLEDNKQVLVFTTIGSMLADKPELDEIFLDMLEKVNNKVSIFTLLGLALKPRYTEALFSIFGRLAPLQTDPVLQRMLMQELHSMAKEKASFTTHAIDIFADLAFSEPENITALSHFDNLAIFHFGRFAEYTLNLLSGIKHPASASSIQKIVSAHAKTEDLAIESLEKNGTSEALKVLSWLAEKDWKTAVSILPVFVRLKDNFNAQADGKIFNDNCEAVLKRILQPEDLKQSIRSYSEEDIESLQDTLTTAAQLIPHLRWGCIRTIFEGVSQVIFYERQATSSTSAASKSLNEMFPKYKRV